jgi:hypothetical protein
MTPEERQLLTGLFDRVRAAEGTPRDREAEAFIADAVGAQPHAPYLLAQTVIVQEHALRAANDRLQQLEAQVRDLQSAAAPSQGSCSFLGGLGKSLFGAEPPRPAPPPRASVPPGGPWGTTQTAYAPPPPPASQPQWSAAPQAPIGGGGSFLHGALGAAAGVAGGVLLADSIRGLFSGHANPFGIGSGFGGGSPGGFGSAGGGGETIVNNYYQSADDGGRAPDQSAEAGQYDDGGTVNDADFSDTSGDWGSSDDGTTDI